MSQMRKSERRGESARTVKPAGANRSTRRPRVRPATPLQLVRQEKALYLKFAENMSTRAIAKKLGVDQKTIIQDIHSEAARLHDELKGEGGLSAARGEAIAFYSHVMSEALKRAKKAFGSRCYDSALKARERIDKLLGLDEAVKLDIGIQPLLDAIDDHE